MAIGAYSAHPSPSSGLPPVTGKIDQSPYIKVRLRSNVVIGNTRAIQNSFSPAHYLARVLPINAKGFTGVIWIDGSLGSQVRVSGSACSDLLVLAMLEPERTLRGLLPVGGQQRTAHDYHKGMGIRG